jgi:ABC-type lipoprotein export system ATPase subunit
MTDFKRVSETKTIKQIIELYPLANDFFVNFNLQDLPKDKPIETALEKLDDDRLAEFGFSRAELVDQFTAFLGTILEGNCEAEKIRSITIIGGRDKLGVPEKVALTINAGEVVSIVGPTGSGKSQLLSDIECIAQKDTPTRRQILINGEALSDEDRFRLDGKLVAQLSQNMNFVMDLTVAEFLEMHTKSRLCKNPDETIKRCFKCANELAGEAFSLQTKVTQLSGGQSRALMIAGTAFISASPVVLIDEIENAGIDRKQAICLLAKKEKIVLISTHDPFLALNADRRIVIKNGGIYKVIETSEEERRDLSVIEAMDSALQSVRNDLRKGNPIVLKRVEAAEAGWK